MKLQIFSNALFFIFFLKVLQWTINYNKYTLNTLSCNLSQTPESEYPHNSYILNLYFKVI